MDERKLYDENLFSLQYKQEHNKESEYTDCIRCKEQPKIIKNEFSTLYLQVFWLVSQCRLKPRH